MARRVPHALRTVLVAVPRAPARTRALIAAAARAAAAAGRGARRAPGAVITSWRTLREAARPLAHPVRVIREGFRLRHDRAGILAHLAIVLAFLALGLVLALPPEDVTRRCPAPGEGRDWCVLQKSYLPLFLIVFSSLCLGQLAARTALVRFPDWRAHRRAVGERRVEDEDVRDDPPYTSDPFLLAATWGQKKGPTERRRPDPLGWVLARRDAVLSRVRRRRLSD